MKVLEKKHFNDSKAFIEYFNDIIFINEDYNGNKECKISIVFDNMIADMLCNKKLNPILTELFLEEENWTFPLFILHKFISLGLKKLN